MRSRSSGGGSSGGRYPGGPQIIPLHSTAYTDDAFAQISLTVDNRVRGNAYVEPNAVDAASFARHVMLGPRGSIWSPQISYVTAPDAPKFDIYLASATEPDPSRGGVDDAGTLLEQSSLTYVKVSGPLDTYAAAFTDDGHHGTLPFRLQGADGVAFTAFGANDSFGFRTIDGGAGAYVVRLKTNGKNAASTGYHLRITELSFVRVDDFSYP